MNLSKRFYTYFSKKAMSSYLNTNESKIYSALLKYDYDNFNLEILEYCKYNKLTEREQYYIDKLKPQYNILKTGNSRLGAKHTIDAKALMSIKQSGINNPNYEKTLTLKTRLQISESLKTKYKNNKPKLNNRSIISLRNKPIKIKIYDKFNILINEFTSIKNTARHFNISDKTVRRYVNDGKFHYNYIFKS